MELDVDPTAPSTASRLTPPCIPLSPPSHHTIQYCLAPSKRAAQYFNDATTQSPIDEAYQISNYLPKELREIIQKRQDQERTWYVRLSMCASVVSNVESTLQMYKGDIEKQESEFIRNYVRKTIARLAASENSPKPSLIPLNTKSPFYRYPKPPKDTSEKNSWATIAYNGHKKFRVTMTTPISPTKITSGDQKKLYTSSKSAKINNIPSKNFKKIISYNRLFVRLPLDHEWRNLSPAGLIEVIVKHLAISLASIGLIKPIRTGFTISPCSSGAREALLRTNIGLLDTGAKLEPASDLVPLLVPIVPKFIRTIQCQMEVTKEMLTSEMERVTSIRPTSVRYYGTSNIEAPHRTWIAYFHKFPRPGFRVFDESWRVTLFKKKKAIDFCKLCNGYHPTRNCSRAPSCGNCGSCMHSQKDCKASTKCKNCGGPHRSDNHKCLARPSRHGSPTKEQLKSFRRLCERENQAVARAKVAEQRAISTTESIMISN
ncbi:hypothetical protein EPUL_000477 [Erysiphe pulchra]|uniref:Uncharacterized protein n=1 Tax=Erysiphe pulchra TaxID=225359 RepID=A0A2S4Q183_9PEZI|nr:hypothetical protein EPUL_000477 [Erysiphe pulchra]